jgi:UDP-N-acetylmuramoyl-L-alanyl-D-glutamate--2,6-diaminopimelate ligase
MAQRLSDLLACIDYAVPVEKDVLVSALTCDSRQVAPGSLFIAVAGGSHDGRNFMQQAVVAGAVACLCEATDEVALPTTDVLIIPVCNLREKIAEIAAAFFPSASVSQSIYGVTGTNGKTSCVQFLAQIQTILGNKVGVLGTAGNGIWPQLEPSPMTTLSPIGLHATLSDFYTREVDAIALEVSSHALVQGRVNAVDFNVAIFTNLTRDHLDYHTDMQAYAAAKTLLFNRPGLAYAVVNWDDPYTPMMMQNAASGCAWLGFSLRPDAVAEIPLIKLMRYQQLDRGFLIDIDSPWGRAELELPLLGIFNVSNVLAVVAALCVSGFDFQRVCSAVTQLQSVTGRMQHLSSITTAAVIVDYAHTPDALEQALLSLREHCRGKLWCVFGCGGERDRGKRPQMAAIAERYADCVMVTSDNSRGESTQLIMDDIKAGFAKPSQVMFAADRALAIARVVQSAAIDDIVLLAGRGHEVEQNIEGKIIAASDEELALRTL